MQYLCLDEQEFNKKLRNLDEVKMNKREQKDFLQTQDESNLKLTPSAVANLSFNSEFLSIIKEQEFDCIVLQPHRQIMTAYMTLHTRVFKGNQIPVIIVYPLSDQLKYVNGVPLSLAEIKEILIGVDQVVYDENWSEMLNLFKTNHHQNLKCDSILKQISKDNLQLIHDTFGKEDLIKQMRDISQNYVENDIQYKIRIKNVQDYLIHKFIKIDKTNCFVITSGGLMQQKFGNKPKFGLYQIGHERIEPKFLF